MAASPLLTRLYTPDNFGRFSLFSAFISFASVCSALRYETAIVAAESDEEANYLTLAALGLTLIAAFVSAGLGYLLIAGNLFGFGALPPWAALLAIPNIVLIAGFTTLRYRSVRNGSFRAISRATIEQNAARAIVPVLLGLLSTGWAGLVCGDLVARGFGLRAMLWQSWRFLRSTAGSFQKATAVAILRKHRAFPLYMLPSSVLNTIALLAPLPLVAHMYGIEAAGFFGLVQRLIALPLSLVAANVADVFHGRIAEYQRENVPAIRGLFLRTAGGLLLIGLGPALVLMLAGPWLFGAAFGPQWGQAGMLAAVMAPMALAQLVVSPISRAVLVVGGLRTKLIYDLSALGAIGLAGYVGYAMRLSLVETIALLSALNVLSYIVYFLVLLKAVSFLHKGRGDI
ncbi:MAG: oligosaccharide flippase family protein [Oscillochloris sp.]|nr:oligosaccharide flippase family protein [Oscillochloris sp.]